MTVSLKTYVKVFEREWHKRFRLVRENGTPFEQPKEGPGETSPHEVEPEESEEMDLTKEELEEMELMVEIGDFLDEITGERY